MTFQVIRVQDAANAQSPFRIIEPPMGREVEWVNRFLAHAAVDGGGRGLGMLAGLKSQVVQQIRGIAA